LVVLFDSTGMYGSNVTHEDKNRFLTEYRRPFTGPTELRVQFWGFGVVSKPVVQSTITRHL